MLIIVGFLLIDVWILINESSVVMVYFFLLDHFLFSVFKQSVSPDPQERVFLFLDDVTEFVDVVRPLEIFELKYPELKA